MASRSTMTKRENSERFGLLWLLPIMLIFLVGGMTQYAGLLSQTQSNWLALLLFSHVFLKRPAWAQIRHETLLFLFLLFMFVDYFRIGNPASYTLTYVYYVLCTIVAAVSGRVYASRVARSMSTESFFKIVKIFLSIELFVVSTQRLFTEQFISLSRVPIGSIDAIFGTFFLQSDAALAAVCELLTISTFLFSNQARDRFVVAAMSLAIIFMGNSNTAKIAIVFLLVLAFVYDAYGRLRVGRYAFNILALVGIVSISALLYSPLSGLLTEFSVQATKDYYHRDSWETASRFSPMGEMFANGINFLGQGALTYYNPLTKRWLYNAGFSTIYSLYLDFGLAGMLFYFTYQIMILVKFTRNYLEMAIFLGVFVFFISFNFALTDLAFVFSFNAVLYMNYLRGKSSAYMDHKLKPLLSNGVTVGHLVPHTRA